MGYSRMHAVTVSNDAENARNGVPAKVFIHKLITRGEPQLPRRQRVKNMENLTKPCDYTITP